MKKSADIFLVYFIRFLTFSIATLKIKKETSLNSITKTNLRYSSEVKCNKAPVSNMSNCCYPAPAIAGAAPPKKRAPCSKCAIDTDR